MIECDGVHKGIEGINEQLQSLVVCQSILGLIHHPGNRAQHAMLDPLCLNANWIEFFFFALGGILRVVFVVEMCVCVCFMFMLETHL